MKYNSDGLVAVTDWYETFLAVVYMGKATLCLLRHRQCCLITYTLLKRHSSLNFYPHRRCEFNVCCCTIYERFYNTCVHVHCAQCDGERPELCSFSNVNVTYLQVFYAHGKPTFLCIESYRILTKCTHWIQQLNVGCTWIGTECKTVT